MQLAKNASLNYVLPNGLIHQFAKVNISSFLESCSFLIGTIRINIKNAVIIITLSITVVTEVKIMWTYLQIKNPIDTH